MANRNYKKKSSKVQPSVMTMSFTVPISTSGKEIQYIDLSQCASLLNRRFYRQGINWAVSGFKILSGTGVLGQVSINKLPNTWILSNSWEKTFRAWSKMNREALSESPSVKPKFLDFKIYADGDHHSLGYGANLLPHSSATLGAAIQDAVAGEWEPSKLVIPKTNGTDDTISHEIIAVGSNYPGTGASGFNAVSLIEGYAASRGLPDILDPNTPDDSALANGSTPQNYLSAMFNEGTDQASDVIDDMISENNLAPYPFENDGVHTDTMYPGGANQLSSLEIHDQEFITGSTIGGTTRLKGGNFPCGLIAISTFGFKALDRLNIQVSLVPGSHRGYLCEPMTEM